MENSKYISNQCIVCAKIIDEAERQKIISFKLVQTWCTVCLLKYTEQTTTRINKEKK